jgi:hypothetical protein
MRRANVRMFVTWSHEPWRASCRTRALRGRIGLAVGGLPQIGAGSLATRSSKRCPGQSAVALAVFAAVGATGCLEEPSASGQRSLVVGDDTDATTAPALMPDVICLDLQEAQDLIQESGVFFSRSVDATGEGRKQIMDRNWVVVGQTPAAGAPIGEGEAELAVVKDDEPSICDGMGEEAAAAPPQTAPPTTAVTTTTVPATTTTTVATTTLPPTTTTVAPPSPPPPPPPPPPTAALQPFIPQSDCDPNYTGDCVPIASDVDCASGTGNGPAYVRGPVQVVGGDIYDLDGTDNDGIGCES